MTAPPAHRPPMIQTFDLRKEYRMGDSVVHALAGVNLTIGDGELVSITGSSGSGKSTLMHLLGLLDRATSGHIVFDQQEIWRLSNPKLAQMRNRSIGFVFQTFNLIRRTSALENVMVPLVYARRRVDVSKARAALEKVGLGKRSRHSPSELSGGECQRVAIARAIVNEPKLILADEPTGNLDTRTGEQIMGIFRELHDQGITVVIVTHEMDVAVQAKRMIHMRDGLIVEDTPVSDDYRNGVLSASQSTQHALLRQKDAAADATPAAPGTTPGEAMGHRPGGFAEADENPGNDPSLARAAGRQEES